MLALEPKRQEASELVSEAEQLQVCRCRKRRPKPPQAAEAKHEFPADYRQLVVLGQAVPASDETSSLLVELNQRRRTIPRVEVRKHPARHRLRRKPAAPAAATPAAPAAAASAERPRRRARLGHVPPTEAAASLLPLGATIGTAGLGVMPYSLTFSGDFFHIADFIKGIDSLVHTGGSDVAVDGRLVTLDGFALNAEPEPRLPAPRTRPSR